MKLQSFIPGVKVRLTPNPLRCETTLTDSARREILLLLALETCMEQMFSAKFDLENDGRSFFGSNPPKDGKASAIAELEECLEPWLSDDKQGFERYTAMGRASDVYLAALNEQHMGDCVKVACSCSRCRIEDLIGIDTRPGDRDSRPYIWDIYANSPQALPEDIEQLKEQRKIADEYRAKYGEHKWSTKHLGDRAKWEPIWAANKAKAREHYEEHKRLYAEQEERTNARTHVTYASIV